MTHDDRPEKPRRMIRFVLGASVLAGVVVLGALAFSGKRHANTAAEPSEMAPQKVATPSVSASKPVANETPSPKVDDTAKAAEARVKEAHSLVVAPLSPAPPKPTVRPQTPSKPRSATKQLPPPQAPSKPPAKPPESAYEHM
jgi:hypothetical protein